MSEKEFLKEKDLLLNSIEKNTVEHWENYYSNVPIKCIFEDLVIDINEIKKLTNENQELKNQLETLEKSNKQLISKLDRYDAIVDERDELKRQLEEYKRLGFKHLNDKCNKLENQQKEFIEYLENEIKERKIQILGYHPTTQLLIEQIIETEKMVLSKYKEIIGGKDEDNKQ